MTDATLYHNPSCGTSRKVLAGLKAAGASVRIIEYLKTPLDQAGLRVLLDQAGLGARDLLRDKENLCQELGLLDAGVGEQALLDAMAAHPILMNRPVVSTALGTRLCRPAQTLHLLLTPAQRERMTAAGHLTEPPPNGG